MSEIGQMYYDSWKVFLENKTLANVCYYFARIVVEVKNESWKQPAFQTKRLY